MEGLILRLADLDEGALGAVRIIAFFDGFVEHRASLEAVLSATAQFAGCEVGLAGGSVPPLAVRAGGGVPSAGDPPDGVARAPVGDDRWVWLARPGQPLAQDRMLLDRLAHAVRALSPRPRLDHPGTGDPALLELVLGAGADDAGRARALRLLGIEPTCPVTVYAVRSPDPAAGAEFLAGLHPWVRAVRIGDVRAVVGREAPADEPTIPTGVQVGRSAPVPASAAQRAWRGARTALRFTGSGLPAGLTTLAGGSALVTEESLGVWRAIAEQVPGERLAASPDVAALRRLGAEPQGPQTLAMLVAVGATASLRQAAAVLYVHHSTLIARLTKAERVLGFSIDTPAGRTRLTAALIIRALCADLDDLPT
ncbi:PucR C-terminal helix-turn-helix domain [Frankia torreyi]|uniref:PucR C-terminal helix-turn-helix domain n=1 Tax=Frankia torreyi TaxID=1856 RepID=A0A0D8B9Z3_9ACTN|nr:MULTISPECIES: helix-turn-helix domain-containing protein [Frankia]KJE21006.1 PucR C-terminal helix-turn-helix domain [Frankia torreyi]KQC35915.1 LysR family transcriptional regulator [Frankia sp. ACN1ag]KQM03879.1 PucR C-terminal helix-turn-helix domain [Frankia sp. CpI1-P]